MRTSIHVTTHYFKLDSINNVSRYIGRLLKDSLQIATGEMQNKNIAHHGFVTVNSLKLVSLIMSDSGSGSGPGNEYGHLRARSLLSYPEIS